MRLAGATVAVTGATGFVGRYLLERLVELDCKPLALTRTPCDLGSEVMVAATHYTPEELADLMTGVDAVVHLGGRRMTREDEPSRIDPFLDPNVVLTGNLLDAAMERGVERFLLASTIAVYSPACPMPYREDAGAHPANAYALSKMFAEDYLTLKARGSKMEAAALRLAAIYGHGEKGTPALMKFVNQAHNRQTLRLTGDPNHHIDQIYVRDAVSAFIAALEARSVDGAYNIGCGEALSVDHIATSVNRIFGNAGNLDSEDAVPKPPRATYMNIARAGRDLGWKPAYSLEQGLEDFRSMISAADDQE